MWSLSILKDIGSIAKDIGLWIKNIFTSQTRIRSLEKENLDLKQKDTERAIKELELQETILTLQKEISKHTHIDSLLGNLTFDTRIGIYRETSGISLCQKCLHSKKQKIPLTVSPAGWTCKVCGSFYPNPDYRPPEHKPQRYNPFTDF